MSGQDAGFTVGQYLVARLRQAGVRHIFGVPGDYVLDLMDCVVGGDVAFVNTCNELNAGYAADGYARLHGIGVAMVTYGVGGFSLLNAVAGAYAERVPLVIVSGAPNSAQRRGHLPMHHIATDYRLQYDVFAKVTARAAILRNPDEACERIDRVLAACIANKRPVYIEVPVDMVGQPCARPDEFRCPARPKSDPAVLAECVDEAARLLAESETPAVLVGVEVHRFALQDRVELLLERSGWPVATTISGKTAIAEDHPQFLGVYEGGVSRDAVRERIESADGLLCLGAWFTDVSTGGFTAKLDDCRTIYANSDRVKIRHHHYDNVYLHEFIAGLAEAVPQVAESQRFACAAPHLAPESFLPVADKPICVDRFFERLNHFLGDDMILIAGTGDAMFGAAELHTSRPESFIAQANYLSIGYSLPATLGVGLARPAKRPVLCIGDGAFQMTAQAISTLLRQNIRPVVFLLNNDGYGIERAIHDGPYNDLQQWKYHELPRVLGGTAGLVVRTEGDLEAAMKAAMDRPDELVFIELILARDDCTEAVRRLGRALRAQATGAST